MSFTDVLVEHKDGIEILRLNRPEVRNALRKETIKEMMSTLDTFSKSSSDRALIITAVGDRSFCAGGDIHEMAKMRPSQAKEFAVLAHRLVSKIQRIPKPVLVAINGSALGAGCDLVSACDISIASESSTFGMPSLDLGLITPFTGTLRFPMLVGPARAKYMFMTGEILNASSALEIGLVGKIVKHESLLEETQVVVRKVLEKPPHAFAFAKKLLNEGSYGHLLRKEQLEIEFYSRCFGTDDTKEGLRAFIEKRKPTFGR